MSSAVEAELVALYINSKCATKIQHTLAEMGHLQPPTPIQIDNYTAYGVIMNKIIPKATKVMDMNFHWLSDCKQQHQFRFYWRPGKTNDANYWTKHHPVAHHKLM